jgi:hypothetical protein
MFAAFFAHTYRAIPSRKNCMKPFDPSHDIRILREPTVYLMGRQVIDDSDLDRFLADHGVTWETDTEVAAEHLVEVAGRVCYMSFAKPRPGGNNAYIRCSNTPCGTCCSRASAAPARMN